MGVLSDHNSERHIKADKNLTDGKILIYAGFWKRFLAFWIDTLLFAVVASSPFMPYFLLPNLQSPANFIFSNNYIFFFYIAALLIFWHIYYGVLVAKNGGQTVGKKLLAIKIIRENGQPLTVNDCLERSWWQYYISPLFLNLGFLWMIWDLKKQAWHDKRAQTLVVEAGGKSQVWLAVIIVIPTLTLISIPLLYPFGLILLGLIANIKPPL